MATVTAMSVTAHDVVDRQVAAYNAKDAQAFADVFAPDVEMTDSSGAVFVRGRQQLFDHYGQYFRNEPDLHCDITNRIIVGNFVVDEESLSGGSRPPMKAIGIYEIRDGQIVRAQYLTA